MLTVKQIPVNLVLLDANYARIQQYVQCVRVVTFCLTISVQQHVLNGSFRIVNRFSVKAVLTIASVATRLALAFPATH